MIVKIVTLFLIFMVVLAMFGRLRLPGTKPGAKGVKTMRDRLAAKRCRVCGAPLAGRGPCPCGKG